MATPLPERIAHLALDTFESLPQKYKPRTLTSGRREWTPMSAVTFSRLKGRSSDTETQPDSEDVLKIVSLATGTKSLPVSALPKCQGLILHDCHAEVLALRGLNYWLLCEMERILSDNSYASDWLESNYSEEHIENDSSNGSDLHTLAFILKKGVEISMYSTTAPCGDASMELLMAAARAAGQDAEPWKNAEDPHKEMSDEKVQGLPPGRGYFSKLGVLRRKPARADAEISMSKSCTDKIMLKQLTSMISFPTCLFIEACEDTFLKRLVLYQDQYDRTGYKRAFAPTGRLEPFLESCVEGESTFRFFDIETIPHQFRRFEFDRESSDCNNGAENSKTSNISALWIAEGDNGRDLVEVLVNGVRQGYRQFDARSGKGSAVCRRNLVIKAVSIAQLLQDRDGIQTAWLDNLSKPVQYSDLKASIVNQHRKDIKSLVLNSLGGWPKKTEEDDFTIDPTNSPTQYKTPQSYLKQLPLTITATFPTLCDWHSVHYFLLADQLLTTDIRNQVNTCSDLDRY